jgi:hypothetical protein
MTKAREAGRTLAVVDDYCTGAGKPPDLSREMNGLLLLDEEALAAVASSKQGI